MTTVTTAAQSWHEAGASVLPAIRGKRPAVSWTAYQEDRADWAEWPWETSDGLGLVTGYGGFEMLEIEGSAAHLIEPLGRALAEAGLLAKLSTYIESTPSGGLHWIYRVESGVEQEGSVKLARSAEGKTMIETRGRFAWVVVAPSGGAIHEEIQGGAWTLVGNSTPGVVATLTEEEVEQVYDICRSFNELEPPAPEEHRQPLQMPSDGLLAPGQDYEARSTWSDVLEPLGWTRTPGRAPGFWTRPGKRYGVSADETPSGNLYVFSSSAYPLEEGRSYTKFHVYTMYEHSGDFAEAARALRNQGYGSPRPEPVRLMSVPTGPSVASTDGSSALAPERSVDVAYTLSDDGNALLLAASAQGKLLYCPQQKKWLHWTGMNWAWDADDAAPVQMMREIVRRMDTHGDTALEKHKHKSMSWTAVAHTIEFAERDPTLTVAHDNLDADPYALNTPTGTINLITGELSPPVPGGLHTRLTGCPVDFEAECPRWTRFLAETFAGDATLIEFVQRLAGYSATGKVTHHVLPFLNGVGANGKSVFMNVLQGVLGTYAIPAPANFLLSTYGEDLGSIARLAGARLVVCSEVGPTARFDEQKVKDLTGGDPLAARFAYGRHFEWVPTHHLWLMGNHQPRVDAGGVSFWRRLRLVPFTRIVPEPDRIEGLAEQLVEEEGPAILAWIAAGARSQLQGLAEPETVKMATFEYAEEEDHLGRFMEERVVLGGGEHVKLNTKSLRANYEQWCLAEGIKPLPSSPFGRELKNRGVNAKQSNGQRFYIGVSLRQSSDSRPRQLGLD
jgi:putative DNA primase/helicase